VPPGSALQAAEGTAGTQDAGLRVRSVSGAVGLIANPAAGKDIRRLVAHASVFDNTEKRNILRRVILGAVAAGAAAFRYMPDRHGLVERALAELPSEVPCLPVAVPGTDSALDTTRAAAGMRAAGCAVIVTLGGDGTNRAVARGWPDAPVVALSTGTNNVFPAMIEGTVAGAAAGLVATGAVALAEVATRAKRVDVQIEGEPDDLALIDTVLFDGVFGGARALWEPGRLRHAVLTRADPAAVGIAGAAGLLTPVDDADEHGLEVVFGAGGCVVRAAVAPGLFRDVPVRLVRGLAPDEPVTVRGPGILAFDGERERPLAAGQTATLRVRRDGPWVVDVRAALTRAARQGLFRTTAAQA
jgi:predicted polyphosphate/ATP-dependent NAD kinase